MPSNISYGSETHPALFRPAQIFSSFSPAETTKIIMNEIEIRKKRERERERNGRRNDLIFGKLKKDGRALVAPYGKRERNGAGDAFVTVSVGNGRRHSKAIMKRRSCDHFLTSLRHLHYAASESFV